jgi:hypothetical protein
MIHTQMTVTVFYTSKNEKMLYLFLIGTNTPTLQFQS